MAVSKLTAYHRAHTINTYEYMYLLTKGRPQGIAASYIVVRVRQREKQGTDIDLQGGPNGVSSAQLAALRVRTVNRQQQRCYNVSGRIFLVHWNLG
jgi:hypothetical protein